MAHTRHQKFNQGLVIIFLAMFSALGLQAQNTEIDSLKSLLLNPHADTTHIDILCEISELSYVFSLDSTESYALKAMEQSKEIGYRSGEATAYNLLLIKPNYNREFSKAIDYANKGLAIADEINDHECKSRIYNSLAVVYYNMKDNNESLKCLQLALEHGEKAGDMYNVGVTYGNCGFMHFKEGNVVIAEEYFLKAEKIGIDLDNINIKGLAARHLGMLYANQKDYEKANQHFDQALEISKEQNSRYLAGYVKILRGKMDVKRSHFESAKTDLFEGIAVFKEMGDLEHQLEGYSCLLTMFNNKNDHRNALKYANIGLALAEENKSHDYMANFYEQMSESYALLGDYQNAFKYHQNHKNWTDTIFTIEKSEKVIELETKYQIEKKEVENQLLKEEQARQVAVIKHRSTLFIALFVVLLLVSALSFLLFLIYKKNKNYSTELETKVNNRTMDLGLANNKLQQSNNELERFAYIASHDLKEPLRNIISFSDLLKKEIPEEENLRANTYINVINKNTKQLHSLVRDTLEYSKLSGNENNVEYVDLNKTINTIKSSISTMLEQKGGVIESTDELPIIKANKTQMLLLFKNLIENGLKYNENENPKILIDSKPNGNFYTFEVSDNGIGMDSNRSDKIFEMFSRLHNRSTYEGTGLGLSLCKKIITKLGGKIWVDSIPGSGSQFYFTIPKA